MPLALPITRTGLGFDSHLFSNTGTLVLGGLKFSGVPQLRGHSDGDALLHAVIDALLGAACLGDIGDFFPDTSQKLRGISSGLLLKRVLKKIKQKGWIPAHVDVTVLANQPRLTPVKSKMKMKLALVLGVTKDAVSIKAKTQEGLTWFESPGGIAVWAVATVVRKKV
ncbi:MAG: 2-C-methyl-D-erythritol 2,4-cyclodiphosphate synthase [Elusimicrobia bacterium]|nr:2-C-methyl-D-erythritol 2,4-cyclodiphosphate synthase [Elusimicrobiota bacterium]